MMTTKIIFFGTGKFAVPILEKMTEVGFRTDLVVISPDAPKGRDRILTPSAVKVAADALGLEVFQPITLKDASVLERIRAIRPDVGVLAAYGKIIPKDVIDLFSKGIINVHPSLLPHWRGATPIQAAILAGDDKTGVTLILLDEEVDHGPILAHTEVLADDLAYDVLHDKLAESGAELVINTLPKWLEGTMKPMPQRHELATFCKKFTREDAKIDWSKSAQEIDRMVRALNPEPGTWTTFGSAPTVLKILSVGRVFAEWPSEGAYAKFRAGLRPGRIDWFENGQSVSVDCKDDILLLDSVQPEGKKPMTGAEFLRGHRELIGAFLD